MMMDRNAETYAAIAETISKEMIRVTGDRENVFVNTPIFYPSGSSVVVQINGSGNRFYVSDFGMGFHESEMIDAGHSYSMIARNLVRDTGVSFDSRSFFVAESTQSEIVPIASAVANFSQRAVTEAIFRHEEKKADIQKQQLVSRLESVFGKKAVEKDIEIRGASSIEWGVAARVKNDDSATVFDYAKAHKNSVVNTVAKFHDIARLSKAPRRVVTVQNREAMGDMIGLLSQSADVISLSEVSDQTLRRMAA